MSKKTDKIIAQTQNPSSALAECIATTVVLLMVIGTVFVFSAGSKIGSQLQLKSFYEFPELRQILFFPIACVIMYTVAQIDYHRFGFEKSWFKSPTGYLLLLAVALLIIVLIPGLGTEINHARRWFRIHIGSFVVSVQPSEIAKWALIVFLSAVFARLGSDVRSFWKRFVPICSIIALIVGLIVIEDFGTAGFIGLLSLIILLAGGVKLWHLLVPLPLAIGGFLIVLVRSPGRMVRLWAFIDPEKWAGTAAYQANQSLIAMGSGGLMGKGLGRGICKYGHLPEDTTDFIFAIIAEEMGLIGTATVIMLFVLLLICGVIVVFRTQDRFGRLLAGSIVLAIGIQAALNIGVVTVVLPTKGIPLPFVSAGGTSMLLSAAAVGVLINIAKQSCKVQKANTNRRSIGGRK